MTEAEKIVFRHTEEGRAYLKNLDLLEDLIGKIAYEQYREELYGGEESVPQSVFPSQNKPSREDELKTKIEDTYAKILGMTEAEKNNFMNTAEGRAYSDNWEALKQLLGSLPFKQYMRGLFGEDKESGVSVTDIPMEDFFDRGRPESLGNGGQGTGNQGDNGESYPWLMDERKLKESIEEVYAKIIGMTNSEKRAFVSSDDYKEYQNNLKVLELLLGSKAYEKYRNELFGNAGGYSDDPDWYKTAPLGKLTLGLLEQREKYEEDIIINDLNEKRRNELAAYGYLKEEIFETEGKAFDENINLAGMKASIIEQVFGYTMDIKPDEISNEELKQAYLEYLWKNSEIYKLVNEKYDGLIDDAIEDLEETLAPYYKDAKAEDIWDTAETEFGFVVDEETEFSLKLVFNLFTTAEEQYTNETGFSYQDYQDACYTYYSENILETPKELLPPVIALGNELFGNLEELTGMTYDEIKSLYNEITAINDNAREHNNFIADAMSEDDFADYAKQGAEVVEWSDEIAFVDKSNGRLNNHDILVVINNPDLTKVDYSYKYLTENEKNVLRYYYAKGDLETFEEFLKDITPNIDKRRYLLKKIDREYNLDQLGAGGKALAALYSLGAGTLESLSAFEVAYYSFKYSITGEYEITNPYSPMQMPAVLSNDMKDYTLEDFGEVGKKVGEGLFSIAEDVRDTFLTGGYGSVKAAIKALNAAGRKSSEALLSGSDYSEAANSAIATVLIDQITDIVFEDNDVVKGITKEVFTTLLDIQIRGENSDYNLYIQDLISKGYSEEDAEKNAIEKYFVIDTAEAAASGYMSTVKDEMKDK